MTDRSLASSADYADAMLVARRAKNILILILLLAIVTQILFGRDRDAGFHFSGKCSNVAARSDCKIAPVKNMMREWGGEMLEFAEGLARPGPSARPVRMPRLSGRNAIGRRITGPSARPQMAA